MGEVMFETAEEWRRILAPTQFLDASLKQIYGTDSSSVLHSRALLYRQALDSYLRTFPSSPSTRLFIVRSPARVNLRGMHVDNHGGFCNGCAISKEIILVVGPEQSAGQISIRNSDASYQPSQLDFDLSATPKDVENQTKSSNWFKYVFGAVTVLKDHIHQKNASTSLSSGFSAYAVSDIPSGAALGSSHAFVLSILLAALGSNPHLNSSAPSSVDLILLARSAEGKAGTVTGLADQGLMLLSRAGQICHSTFYQGRPQDILPQYVTWPKDLEIILIDSRVRRRLAGAQLKDYALPRFAYSLALALIQEEAKSLPTSSKSSTVLGSVERLAQLAPEPLAEALGSDTYHASSLFYRLLKSVPLKSTVEDLRQRYPNLAPAIEKGEAAYLKNLDVDGNLEIELRGPLLFGVAECARASKFYRILKQLETENHPNVRGDLLKKLGRLMNDGHLGDSREPAPPQPTDESLEELAKKIQEGNLEAEVEKQPGDFKASLVELDKLQKLAVDNGAVGSSLTGAGLGGVLVAIAPAESVHRIREAIFKEHPVPGNEEAFHPVLPIAGSGYLVVNFRPPLACRH